MSKQEEEGKKIPEWNIFDRIDELENITLDLMEKTDTTKPELDIIAVRLKDAMILGTCATYFCHAITSKVIGQPRQVKDMMLNLLKEKELSEDILDILTNSLNMLCETIEERGL